MFRDLFQSSRTFPKSEFDHDSSIRGDHHDQSKVIVVNAHSIDYFRWSEFRFILSASTTFQSQAVIAGADPRFHALGWITVPMLSNNVDEDPDQKNEAAMLHFTPIQV